MQSATQAAVWLSTAMAGVSVCAKHMVQSRVMPDQP